MRLDDFEPIEFIQGLMFLVPFKFFKKIPFLWLENTQEMADDYCFRGPLRCRAINSNRLCERCVSFSVCLYVFFP